MTTFPFPFSGTTLTALGTGALWWEDQSLLCISDLHLGKSERHARRGGGPLPPYETQDTLARLADHIDELRPKSVICLGDSFDDGAAAQNMTTKDSATLHHLVNQRHWIWITGNHDPQPLAFGGTYHHHYAIGPLTFCHIATSDASGEISGHYHPKARVKNTTRPAFLVDQHRVILPAFGTYTGGLNCTNSILSTLMQPQALAILTGPHPLPVPMPR